VKLGVALVLGVAAWEAILSAWVFRPAAFHQDADFGWMPQPHAVAFTNIEGRTAAFYNERGFRDEAITPRQPGELRVLCLGDSFVEALDVPREQSFEFLLQQQLSKYLQGQNQPGLPKTARVFNAGRAGTSVAGVLHFAPAYAKLFDPDLVIVMVHDEWKVPFDRTQEVRLVPQGEGFRVQMTNHSESSGAMFRRLVKLGVRDMAVATHGSRQLRLMRTKGADPEAADEPQSSPTPAPTRPLPQADAPSAGEKSDSLRRDTPLSKVEGGPGALDGAGQAAAVDSLDAMLVRAAAWVPAQLKSAYPRLLVVEVPQTSVKLHGLMPVSATESAFLQACRAQNISTVDMRPAIEEDFARTQEPPFGFPTTLPWVGHFNAHGHELIARTLFEDIRAETTFLRPQVLEAPKTP
jgi:hypothetical protein